MTAPWPWPNDSYEVQLRRIVWMFRDELAKANPAVCEVLEANFRAWGHGWVSEDSVIDMDELLTKGEIATKFGIRPHQVRDWSLRWPDKLPCRGSKGNRKLYRAGDVLSVASRRP